MKKILMAWLIVAALAAAAVPAYSDSGPALPMSFYGYAALNAAPLPSGTTIYAYYGSSTTPCGEITTTSSGTYGAANPEQFDPYSDDLLIVSEGDGIIYFKINVTGYTSSVLVASETVAEFAAGTNQRLDLTFTGTKKSSSSSSGGGGGGGGSSYPEIAITVGGHSTTVKASYTGKTFASVDLTSDAGDLELSIPKSTQILTSGGSVPSAVTLAVETAAIDPPEDYEIVSLYSCTPVNLKLTSSGDLPVTLTWHLSALSGDFDPEELQAAFHDSTVSTDSSESPWAMLSSTYSSTDGTLTLSLTHFSDYALLIPVTEEAETVTQAASTTTSGSSSSGTATQTATAATSTQPTVTAAPASQTASTSASTTVAGSETKPFNWGLLGGIIGGVIILGLILGFILRRKKH